jgi:hypothetical protein
MIAPKVAKQSILIKHNSGFSQPILLLNADGSPFDFSSGVPGAPLTAQIRDTPDYTPNPLVWFDIEAPIPTSGECTLNLSAHDAGLLPLNSNTSFSDTTRLFGEIFFVPAADPDNLISLVELDVRVAAGGNSAPAQAGAPTIPLAALNIAVGGASPATARALLGMSPGQMAYAALLMG